MPADKTAFVSFVHSIVHRLRLGERVLIHCCAGIGRTGTFAVCLLRALGSSAEEAEVTVKSARAGPETPSQRDFVSEMGRLLAKQAGHFSSH